MICVYFGRRLETITTSPVGHAKRSSVHCAGRLSTKLPSILVPGDASNILQIATDTAKYAPEAGVIPFSGKKRTYAQHLNATTISKGSAHDHAYIPYPYQDTAPAFPAFCRELDFQVPGFLYRSKDQSRSRILQRTNEELYQECQFLVTCQVFRCFVCFLSCIFCTLRGVVVGLPTYAPFILRSSVRAQVLAITGSADCHRLYWIEVIPRDMPAYNRSVQECCTAVPYYDSHSQIKGCISNYLLVSPKHNYLQ